MKRILSKLLITTIAFTMFSTSVSAYTLSVSDQFIVDNIQQDDSYVYIIDDGLPIKTYKSKSVTNIIATGDDLQNFSVNQILPVEGLWRICDAVEFSYGGTTIVDDQIDVEKNSIVSLTEDGIYYITSQKDGVEEQIIVRIDAQDDFISNAKIATISDKTLTVNNEVVDIDFFEVDDICYIKLQDIAGMFVGTEQEFEITWHTDFSIYQIYPGQTYTVGDYTKSTFESDIDQIAYINAPSLFNQTMSTKIEGYIIDGEHYYDIEKLADKLNFAIDKSNLRQFLTIDTTEEFMPE